ncbi:YceH family protein [Amphibiibacter pelophylacis]|uniref:YceH family protein n=1 Tax=Amphibiibacter pelophylacis TaxID=1799477 RepID=A0ACC6P1J8_9BURK
MDFTTEPLSPEQARVLGTLMEKARTVPDSYPLTLNSLLLGCNQKSSRDPVMNLSEADVSLALDGLRQRRLVVDAPGGRVPRFEHNAQRGIGVPEQSAVLLGLLMLRGPQTAGELRLNTERWYRFLDIASVEGFLNEMHERAEDRGGALVRPLERAPGERETRWAHLLCGPVEASASVRPAATGAGSGPLADLTGRVTELEALTARLQAQLTHLQEQLGVSPPEDSQ